MYIYIEVVSLFSLKGINVSLPRILELDNTNPSPDDNGSHTVKGTQSSCSPSLRMMLYCCSIIAILVLSWLGKLQASRRP